MTYCTLLFLIITRIRTPAGDLWVQHRGRPPSRMADCQLCANGQLVISAPGAAEHQERWPRCSCLSLQLVTVIIGDGV